VVAASVLASGLAAVESTSAEASYAVPPTPTGLPRTIEDIQPYIGQSTCDPVAKPGVVAFRNLLLRTYPDTGSLGITRDCGIGGQSEHKEGRAFDWRVSVYNARQRGEANTLLAWLTRTDAQGHSDAMARRLGIMYMIWNHRIWKVYDPRGWQAYSGPNPHTDHVHFSFGWNGARKVTSYWDKTVAPIDFGPNPPAHVTPVRSFANLALFHQYAGTTLAIPSSGTAVSIVQRALKVGVDGDYGSGTAAAVARFQVDRRLPATQRFGRAEWKALFPPPAAPFGHVDVDRSALGNLVVTGWAIDGDSTGPVSVSAVLGGTSVVTVSAGLRRTDVATAYPEYGGNHGFALTVPVVDGQSLCLVAHNAPGTPGSDTTLRCETTHLLHDPFGALDAVASSLGAVRVSGWALDPDAADPTSTSLTVDGAASDVVPAATSRPDLAAQFPGITDDHGVTAVLSLAAGSHTICLRAANVSGTPGVDAALGCRTVVVRDDPTGALDPVRRVPGGEQVTGWALDPDVATPTGFDLLVDGNGVQSGTASVLRSALSVTWPDQGPAHGLGALLDLAAGTHSVCLLALNATGTPGTDRQVGCRSVVVSHDPSGVTRTFRTVPGGSLAVSGDALDPDSAPAVLVTPIVDGVRWTGFTANRASSSAAARWPGYGSAHGFQASLRPKPGRHHVCLSLGNLAGTPGAARTLTCRDVVISDPVGRVSSVSTSRRTVTVRGWAVDPDVTGPVTVSVYVDGRWRAAQPARYSRADLATVMPGYGSTHGYVVPLTLTAGTHRVCVLSRNVAGTPGRAAWATTCHSVTVA
jgi:peptidoglycan hydrolase-like protein with peptidoglycan-binding domain